MKLNEFTAVYAYLKVHTRKHLIFNIFEEITNVATKKIELFLLCPRDLFAIYRLLCMKRNTSDFLIAYMFSINLNSGTGSG